jgi:hypothetical protein
MVLSIKVPHFPAIGSGGVPPVPPTILISVDTKDVHVQEAQPS